MKSSLLMKQRYRYRRCCADRQGLSLKDFEKWRVKVSYGANPFISYVNVEHKTDRKKLRLSAFKFSINYSVFDALLDTGSAWNIISHKTAEEIDIRQFEKLPDPLSSDMEGKVLFGYSCEVVLADSCKVATHMDVYIGDLTKPTQRLVYSSVPNVISAIDYLKKGWSVTFCKGVCYSDGFNIILFIIYELKMKY